jgi:hypothetical protein
MRRSDEIRAFKRPSKKPFSWIGRKERAAQNIKPGKERTSVRDESEQRNDAVDGQMKGFLDGL